MKATKASTMDQRGMSVSSSLTEKDELESPRAMLTKNTLVEVRQQFRISELLKIIDFYEQLFIESAAKSVANISNEPWNPNAKSHDDRGAWFHRLLGSAKKRGTGSPV